MSLNVELQEQYRTKILQNIDLNLVEKIKEDRDLLINEMLRVIETLLEKERTFLSVSDQRDVAEIMADEISGEGPLRPLLEDESVTDILVNGPENIYIERYGKLERSPYRFINNEQLTDIAKRMVQRVGRRLDESSPLVDARLKDGSRLNVVIPPVALDGTSVSIRKFSKSRLDFNRLIESGAMNTAIANFLIIAARCRVSIIISGGTGSGKTTLLNALSQYIADDERIVTLEDAAELRLMQPHVLRMETRLAGIENTGRVTMRDLLVNSLRMRPDRIIVGECRGEEAFEMLQAMNTGHDGSMSTLHANSPRDAISRLENMVMMAGMNMPVESIRRNIASAINIIIQVSRLNDGTRKIMNISEVMGIEGDCIILQDIFSFKAQAHRDENGKIQGEFHSEGLLIRSAVMQNAILYDLQDELRNIFSPVE
ncbi:CpaF family protein [Salmonella enterica]|uniref:CpaF family protein n=3 Tax=Salmonella enterica TaxID=28901 RepID=A0A5Z5BRX7_SALER|nr:CpaF family protein [Salmonella enterica]EAT8443619.1 CpaF family protein [Salmonella enterica subsp. enterica serovar Bonariensis]EBS4769651.1 CpaF family protein [Salmonella enterica subsp. enterica serovar Sandiego]ECH8235003.1 CpaF family protein [Salmonella enterica subsp. enterica]EIB5177270.1 CpaF family protein [Salmonella enterica subsp. enterica serovar Maracaibo]VEA96185.1 VirB11 ATPase [Salmonella enterica subsp. houtenae]